MKKERKGTPVSIVLAVMIAALLLASFARSVKAEQGQQYRQVAAAQSIPAEKYQKPARTFLQNTLQQGK